MDGIQQALDPLRVAFNQYIAFADTPGAIVTVLLLPVGIILGIVGWLLDRKSSYWRRT